MTEEEARSILGGPKSYAVVRELEGGGAGISAVPRKGEFLPIAVVALVIGPVGFFGGLWLMVHRPTPDWLAGPMSEMPVKLLIGGAICTALGPLLVLMRLVSGPPRTVELEARPGELKADRSIAGDRVRSTYGLNEVLCLFLEDNVLCVETRKGHSQLVAFGTARVNEAIGLLLSLKFWAATGVEVRRVPKRPLGHAPGRVVFQAGGG